MARERREPPRSPSSDVTKRYAGSDSAAVENLSLEVPAGEICVLVGPSGCGKTTAMRMVNRTVEITEGDIEIGDTSVRDRSPAQLRREIGYVIQQIGLFPHRTIAQNIATVPGLVGWDRERDRGPRGRAARADLASRRGRRSLPGQLSGGQQQRVGVARALAADPPVMLMDEPFGAIDPINRERLQNEFLRLQAEIRKTILFVTHDIDEAIKMGDRIAILQEGGHLAQFATPAELLMAPADGFVEDFVGADRALKRLALMRVSDIDLWEAPLAFVGQATGEVRAKLEGAEVPHALLVDSERRPLGWLSDARPRAADRPAAGRQLARPDPRPRRRDARRALRRAPGGEPVRARRRRRGPDRRRPLGRDHPGVPLLRRGEGRGAPGGRAPAADAIARDATQLSPDRGPRGGPGRRRCARENEAFCPGWVFDNIDRYVDADARARHPGRRSRSSLGFAVAFGLALHLAPAAVARARSSSAAPAILYTIPASPCSCCCCRSPGAARHGGDRADRLQPADHLPQHRHRPRQRSRTAARTPGAGMGMTQRQLLWRVEMPLAVPEIIAGMRIATVSTVAIATLAVFAGARRARRGDLQRDPAGVFKTGSCSRA